MSIVYRKTAKGQSEIETRAFRLLPRLRQALILVDGRRSDDELSQMIFAEPRATLEALLADGFIEVALTVADKPSERTPAAAAPAPAPTPAPTPVVTPAPPPSSSALADTTAPSPATTADKPTTRKPATTTTTTAAPTNKGPTKPPTRPGKDNIGF